jgi:predicted phage-related endonuclease
VDFTTSTDSPVWIISLFFILFGGIVAVTGWFIRELYKTSRTNVNDSITTLEKMIKEDKKEIEAKRVEFKNDVCGKINNFRIDVKELYGRTDEIPVIKNQIENMCEDIREIKDRSDK